MKPPATRVFLVRHADASEGDRDAGRGRHLTEIGRRQAAALAHRLAPWKVDAILCSDMFRAEETARAVRSHHAQADFIVDATFRELSASLVEEQLDAPDGVLRTRLEAAWQAILTMPYPTSVVVTHNGLIKYLIGRAIRFQGELKPRFHSSHTGITGLAVEPEGKARIQFFNDTRHLTSELVVDPKTWLEGAATVRGHS